MRNDVGTKLIRAGDVRFCLCEADLIWLARRLADLYPGCRRLSRRETRALCEVVASQIPPDSEAVEIAGDMEGAARGVALLFEVMELPPPGWEAGPRHGALPTVALLPGIGGRLIYGGTADDLWTMEGPDGAQQCSDFPQQGSYSALVSASKAMVRVALPERASQPGALVTFKSALKMGWCGFKLLRRVFSERARHWAARLI